jgi:hypothetical protein
MWLNRVCMEQIRHNIILTQLGIRTSLFLLEHTGVFICTMIAFVNEGALELSLCGGNFYNRYVVQVN